VSKRMLKVIEFEILEKSTILQRMLSLHLYCELDLRFIEIN
jgi:hypothetical protein